MSLPGPHVTPRPLRVLHVHSGNLHGGVEVVLRTLAIHRSSCPSMEAEFALCFRGQLQQELAAAGVPAEDLGPVRVREPWTILRARKRLKTILRRGRFDVVVTHSSWSQAIFGAVARAAKVPCVFYLHDAPSGKPLLERWAKLSAPDAMVCNSEFTRKLARRVYGLEPEVVYCPVSFSNESSNVRSREAIRTSLGTPPSALVVIQVSRMQEGKGHALLIHALGQLTKQPDWMLWIAGGAQRPAEEAYERELHELCERLQISKRVRFLGQRGDVPALLASADIFCQPHVGPEAFGLVFVEALSAGLPVISTNVGGSVEIVNADCGLLVAPDAVPLGISLKALLEDAPRRRRLGANGPARALSLCEPARQMTLLATVLARASLRAAR